jgi:hypothetical protein
MLQNVTYSNVTNNKTFKIISYSRYLCIFICSRGWQPLIKKNHDNIEVCLIFVKSTFQLHSAFSRDIFSPSSVLYCEQGFSNTHYLVSYSHQRTNPDI